MDFPGLREWCEDLKRVWKGTIVGIERVVGILLHVLKLVSPPTWVHIVLNRKDPWITDAYVFIALLFTGWTYFFAPHCWSVLISTYFSTSTVIVLLNIVVLQRVFGPELSPGRSLLLFICNAAQITFMFATWYKLGDVSGPLLKSILTFATIDKVEQMPRVAMAQIATNFVLLAIYLGQLMGRVGSKNGASIGR
jgi:hypothetical protein